MPAWITGLLAALPKLMDWIDSIVGQIKKWDTQRKQAALDKRLEERRKAKNAIAKAKTDEERRDALRRYRRAGGGL